MSDGNDNGWTDERRPGTEPNDEQQQDEQQPSGDEHDGTGETPPEPSESDEQQQDEQRDEDEQQPSNGNAEAAKYRRQRNEARETADKYGRRLFTELVRATGKLTDPTDMPFQAELLDEDADLGAAIDQLVADKPHLKARQFSDMGQHGRSTPAGPSLGDIMRAHA